MSTIKDVAKLAKVSVATVSNVLNKTATVSEEKVNRVLSAMEQLKYAPNVYAKNLRFKRRKLFAVLVSEIDFTTQRILEGITDFCKEHDYLCNLYVTHHNRVQESNYLREIQSSGVEGIFLQTCDDGTNEAIKSVLNKELPIVFIDNYLRNTLNSAVIFNNTSLMETALDEYLSSHKLTDKQDVFLVTADNRYQNDTDAKIGVERVVGDNYTHFTVPAAEEEAFYRLIKYFGEEKRFPKLFLSPRESITSAISQLVKYFRIDADIMYFASESDAPAPHRIPLHRRAYHLGQTAAQTMFRYLKSPLQFDKVLTIISNKKTHKEYNPILPSQSTRLHLTLYDGPTASALIPAIRSFRKQYGIDVEYTLLNYDNLFEHIEEIGKCCSDETDVMMIDLPWFGTFHRENYLYPLNRFIANDNDGWLNNFTDEIKKIYFYTDSVIYSVPILANMQFLFYRKDLFEDPEIMRSFYNKYGIELTPPQSWLEFEFVARFFTREYNPSSPVTYGTTLQGMDPVSISEEFFPRQWAYGGKLLSSRKIPILNSQANVHAFLNLKNIYQCTPKHQIEHSWQKNFTKMTNNEIAMYFNFSTHIGHDSNDLHSIDFSNIAVTKVPGNYSMLGGYNLGINAHSKNKLLAYRFIKWLTSEEMALNNTLMGCCIPHNAVFANDKCTKAFPWLKNMQNYILSARYREPILDGNHRPIPPKTINRIIHDAALEIFRDRDISETLTEADRRLSDVLNA